MNDLLNNPAVQAGIVPFVVALVITLLFRKVRLSGLAILVGFSAMVYLVSGFAFEPLTSSRKIIWIGIATGLMAIPLSFVRGKWWRPILAVFAAGASVWMSVRILQQQPVSQAILWGFGGALYVGWLAFWMDSLNDSPGRSASAGMSLGFGTGAAALIGASALLGQYGLSLGAAASACLLIVFIINGQISLGRSFTLPLSLMAGLVGCLAVLTAQLPWYSLPVLALVPVAAKLPIPEKLGVRLQSVLLSMATMVCAAVAVYLSWRINGLPPI